MRSRSTSFGPWKLLPTLVFVLGAISALLFVAYLLLPEWPPAAVCHNKACKEAREWIVSSITVLVILGGLYQYLRSQVWKRAEFVAAQMSAFFCQHYVRNATLMIDWTRRRIDLFDQPRDRRKWPIVTRALQNRALLPHTVASKVPKIDNASQAGAASGLTDVEALESALILDVEADSRRAEYSATEAAIRDSYDAFLDGLETFAGYISTGLVRAQDLQPYLGYWIKDIVSKTPDREEDAWTCSLLSYIAFYRYEGVQALFHAFRCDIHHGSELFIYFLDRVPEGPMAIALREVDESLRRRENRDATHR
jgi:hypothetical protein